ncbi:alpha/beta fold hydrolase [Candidatus Gottesmanbacteria bacterium]|nr:alpha/beta fold hydrolase [Candidatus Gottesmanbacteria bacterium]
MNFVIIHGSFGSPNENWFPELKEKLESLGQSVVIPQFPVENWDEVARSGPFAKPKFQSLDNWFHTFEEIRKDINDKDDLCFIGHSLGSLFILHLVERYNLRLDSAIFVSPFLSSLGKDWRFDRVNQSFYKTDFNFRALRKNIPTSYVLYSDNDPYVEKYLSVGFAKRLHSSLLMVKRAGHMNSEVNLNEFPLILELCKTRLDLSLYQKYIAHRKELYAIDYLSPNSEEVLYLEPEEVFDEGVFKFRNLRKEGFCTFLTSLKFWDTQSAYYQQARLAAKRMKNFKRVFIVDAISDLKRRRLLDHIRLDLGFGIEVYLCMAKDLINKIGELDFGIWDNDYLCIVRFDKTKQAEVKLSSRRKDINEAKRWKTIILERATHIANADTDIQKFIKRHASLPNE